MFPQGSKHDTRKYISKLIERWTFTTHEIEADPEKSNSVALGGGLDNRKSIELCVPQKTQNMQPRLRFGKADFGHSAGSPKLDRSQGNMPKHAQSQRAATKHAQSQRAAKGGGKLRGATLSEASKIGFGGRTLQYVPPPQQKKSHDTFWPCLPFPK